MASAILGVDVSKHHLDCYDALEGSAKHIPMDRLDEWSRGLASNKARLVVFEATGVYGKRLGRHLAAKGIAYAEVNPRHVRRFAQACGQLAKSDRIDARLIARYAAACGVRAAEAGDAQLEALQASVARREQLLMLVQAEKGHRESCLDPCMASSIDAHLLLLGEMMRVIDADIARHLSEREDARILMSMPGVGQVVAATLLAQMPQLGRMRRGQPASLAGLAPIVRDSGLFKGRRTIGGGKPRVRKVLYMAALVAMRRNAVYKRHCDALTARGKPFKLAITAIMRKMIETLNAMLKYKTTWKS